MKVHSVPVALSVLFTASAALAESDSTLEYFTALQPFLSQQLFANMAADSVVTTKEVELENVRRISTMKQFKDTACFETRYVNKDGSATDLKPIYECRVPIVFSGQRLEMQGHAGEVLLSLLESWVHQQI